MTDDKAMPPGPPGDESPQPAAPFAPEDGAYAAVVSEYVGLQRAGADPLGAALITASHWLLAGLAGAAQQQEPPA